MGLEKGMNVGEVVELGLNDKYTIYEIAKESIKSDFMFNQFYYE